MPSSYIVPIRTQPMQKDHAHGSRTRITLPIALTIGEPAGIGPDIVLQLWSKQPDLFSPEKINVIGNKQLLQERAEILNIACDFNQLSIIDIPLLERSIPGQLNPRNATFVLDMLTMAAKGCLQNQFRGVVTAPVHKGVINESGVTFAGHTDFFATLTKCKTVMMLMTDTLRIALLTDHIPLCKVPDAVTTDNLTQCLEIILRDCHQRLLIKQPRILVCGLNPHAGENGYLGMEEKEIIIPVLEKFRREEHVITGPIGADIAFTEHYRNQADVILALYHDQGLPVIKYAGFHEAINVTLGLPFIRTSVDHGTALELAGTGRADTTSLQNAILAAHSMRSHASAA